MDLCSLLPSAVYYIGSICKAAAKLYKERVCPQTIIIVVCVTEIVQSQILPSLLRLKTTACSEPVTQEGAAEGDSRPELVQPYPSACPLPEMDVDC